MLSGFSLLFALTFLCGAFFSGCSALLAKPEKPKLPKASGKVIEVRQTIRLRSKGKTYDYKGATLVWKGRGDCSQREGMPPMFIIEGDNITLKNATIVGAPDGIHINARKARIERIVFPDVCEDAITMQSRARDAVVRKCYFRKATDKVIQSNYGQGHEVYANTFVDVGQALRIKKGSRVSFHDNVLHQANRAVHADGKGARAVVGGNLFYRTSKPYQAEKSARIQKKSKDKVIR